MQMIDSLHPPFLFLYPILISLTLLCSKETPSLWRYNLIIHSLHERHCIDKFIEPNRNLVLEPDHSVEDTLWNSHNTQKYHFYSIDEFSCEEFRLSLYKTPRDDRSSKGISPPTLSNKSDKGRSDFQGRNNLFSYIAASGC